jgi:diguanylate cyclase (GGDEF)-like protein/PAS domain S-box-containing protein
MCNEEIAVITLEQASDAILITDANLVAPGPTIIYANEAFAQLTGYSVEELVGKSPRILQGPATSRKVLGELREQLSKGKHFSGTTVNYRKSGEPFEIEWQASPIYGPDGTVVQFLSVHRDVTDQANFHRQISQYAQLLVESNARREELERSNRQLLALATTDGLTGLANHRHFHQELARIRPTLAVTSLMLLDVDHFKSFNDTFGHQAGDSVLTELANVLRTCVRENDLLARYGGEEFAILMPGQDADHALAVAERVRAELQKKLTARRPVTVSIGVATAGFDEGDDNKLIDDADVALYAAKAAGRNRVKHSRHLTRVQPTHFASTSNCAQACAPSPGGCLKCQAVPASKLRADALLLAPLDQNVDETLRKVLTAGNFPFTNIGPLLLVSDVRDRLAEIGKLLKDRLSPFTRSCVSSAYVSGGIEDSNQAIAALMFAKPLTDVIENIEHEWVRDALNDNWLFSVFHPIISAKTGEVFAQEALLRARHPGTGQVFGAGQIIKACEELKLTHQLDQRARQAAIRGTAENVDAHVRVFINFLPNTIYDPEVCLRTTMEAAAAYNVSTSRLVFEVVETEKIPDMDHLHHILDYYRDRGMGTAIDDMGAGYTGVDYITSLRPNFVKLDREFVLTAESSQEGRRQMEAMITASHTHGAKVIAEGIETQEQMDLCVRHNVDFLQGFYFARPACPPMTIKWPTPAQAAA